MSAIVFLDTETTGLDERTEDVFEVAIVMPSGFEHVFRIQARTAVVQRMHPKAAEVNRYHERTNPSTGWLWDYEEVALDRMRNLLDGVHICGAVPDFDARHLTALYRRFGQEPPRWHYHLVDIEAMAVGYLNGRLDCTWCGHRTTEHGPDGCAADDEAAMGGCDCPWTGASLPWRSDDLSRACGVEPPAEGERHTALGDARWCKRLYEAITGAAA